MEDNKMQQETFERARARILKRMFIDKWDY